MNRIELGSGSFSLTLMADSFWTIAVASSIRLSRL
jgi:hypothetical protein